MKEQIYQLRDRVRVQRGDHWVITTITGIRWSSQREQPYYTTKIFGDGMWLPEALIKRAD